MMDPIVTIRRMSAASGGTCGALTIQEFPVCLTLEPYWRGNERNISCIPAGSYKCKRHISPKYGEVFLVTGVQGRSNILFHKGNKVEETQGCILLGSRFGISGDNPIVRYSADAFDYFMKWLDNTDEFTLIIKECY